MNTKKKLLYGVALLGVISFAPAAALAAGYTSASGAALTVGTAGSDPATISYQPSPGVSMGVFASASAFSINAVNENSAASAIEYLVKSTEAGYYQKAVDLTADGAAITELTAADQATTNYTYMGGGS